MRKRRRIFKTDPRLADTAAHRKLERHEKAWRGRRWDHFYLTRRGRMSWADWFHMRETGNV